MSAPINKAKFTQDINAPIKAVYGGGLMFSKDNLSNVISVDIVDGGQPFEVTGTVAGTVICSDGTTVPVNTGAISGNTVSLTLTEACFDVPGQIVVNIIVTSGDVKCCVLRAVYTVVPTETSAVVDPGDILPSIADLINAIDAAVASIPADYSGLLASIAGTFSASTAYAAGAYVWYGGTLYRFTAAHAAGSWTGSDATAVTIGGELADLKSAFGSNLAGTSIGYLYPVRILTGEKITISTSDGSTFDQTVKLHYWGSNKNHIGQWALGNSYGNKRTVTANADIYWLSFEWQDADTFGVETGETMQPPYMVNTGTTAETYKAWFEQPQVYALRQDMNAVTGELENDLQAQEIDLENKIVDTNAENNNYRNDYSGWMFSLNANYFDADSAEWVDGLVTTATGAITQTEDYEYAFVPLRGAGTYITQINSTSYGTNARKLALYNSNKVFIKAIEADNYSGHNQKYTLTAADAKTAVYTILQRKKTGSTIPKLFYNPIFADVTNFPIDAGIPFTPKYGAVSDALYKAVIVCDGDSICEGMLDNPYRWHGWFGRIVRNYQASGTNYAVGGGTITDMTNTTVGGNPRHSVAISIDTIVSEYPELDYLILEGGTNDADLIGAFDGETAPEGFGTWDADSMSADYIAALDKSTFCGAVEYVFYKAMVSYPNAKIGFIVPMSMGIYTNQKTNRKRYFDEIIKIAAKWGIPVLNLWDTLHVRANFEAYYDRNKTADENVTAKKFYNDGQHPTSYGYNLMQPIIEAWMRTL